MSELLRRFWFSCIALMVTTPLAAAERWHVSTVKFVYPVANGDFVIGLDSDSSYCTSTSSPNKYYHVYVGQFGVNAAGSSKIYAAAMLALSTRLNLTVVFDDADASCYVNRVIVTN